MGDLSLAGPCRAARRARARLEEFHSWPVARPAARPAAVVGVRDLTAPGPHGPIPVRVHTPPASVAADRPALVRMHGGASVFGGLDMVEADGVAREVCARAGAVVVSVDHRLAVGGMTYPVPHDDVVAAIREVRAAAAGLGIDPGRIGVGGASAGGNLAAGAALRLRDDDGRLPAPLLAYTTRHAVVPPPPPSLARLMDPVPRLLDADYDDLRPSGQHVAVRSALAGVDVRQVLVRGMLHGFLNLPAAALEPVDRALDLVAEVVAGSRAPVPA